MYENKLYVFGGCADNRIEICDLNTFKWSYSITSGMPGYLRSEQSKHYGQT